MSEFEIFYKNEEVYEITINLHDDYQFFGKPLRDIHATRLFGEFLTKHLDPVASYYFIPEFSEVRKCNRDIGKGPRIHYHGLLLLEDAYHFLLSAMYHISRIGDVQINSLRRDYWIRYMKKQSSVIDYDSLKKIRNVSIPYIMNHLNANNNDLVEA